MTRTHFPNFETKRLDVIYWAETLADAGVRSTLAAELTKVLTPRVLHNLPPSLQVVADEGGIERWIQKRAEECDVYLVRDKSQALIGLLIFASNGDEARDVTLHLGYMLAEDSWGQGIATELLTGVLEAAKIIAPVRLLGGVSLDNHVSAHVLRKLGFSRDGDLSSQDIDVFVIELRAS